MYLIESVPRVVIVAAVEGPSELWAQTSTSIKAASVAVHPRDEVKVVIRDSHEQGVLEQGAATEHCPDTETNVLSDFLLNKTE